MPDLSANQSYELELRKIALEEAKERNRVEEAAQARALEQERLAADRRAPTREAGAKRREITVGLVTALAASLATVAAAFVGGFLKVSDTAEANLGKVTLEQQKFAFDKLNDALTTTDPLQRASKLIFLVDIGVLNDRLDPAKIRELAAEEQKGIEDGTLEVPILPNSLGGDPPTVSNFFEGSGPNLDLFRSDAVVADLGKYGMLQSAEEVALLLALFDWQTAGFKTMVENANYTADRLQAIWPKRYQDRALAMADAGDPQAILNRVYGNRMGNSDPGDGYRYRGRGFLQITGKSEYMEAGKAIGVNLVDDPDQAALPDVALRIALIELENYGAISELQSGDVQRLLIKVNGGLVGLSGVIALRAAYLAALKSETYADHPIVKALRGPGKD